MLMKIFYLDLSRTHLEEAGRGDCGQCSAVWCVEASQAILLLPVLHFG